MALRPSFRMYLNFVHLQEFAELLSAQAFALFEKSKLSERSEFLLISNALSKSLHT